VTGSCEYGDEPSSSGATELVLFCKSSEYKTTWNYREVRIDTIIRR
jgi:hypothetical protein